MVNSEDIILGVILGVLVLIGLIFVLYSIFQQRGSLTQSKLAKASGAKCSTDDDCSPLFIDDTKVNTICNAGICKIEAGNLCNSSDQCSSYAPFCRTTKARSFSGKVEDVKQTVCINNKNTTAVLGDLSFPPGNNLPSSYQDIVFCSSNYIIDTVTNLCVIPINSTGCNSNTECVSGSECLGNICRKIGLGEPCEVFNDGESYCIQGTYCATNIPGSTIRNKTTGICQIDGIFNGAVGAICQNSADCDSTNCIFSSSLGLSVCGGFTGGTYLEKCSTGTCQPALICNTNNFNSSSCYFKLNNWDSCNIATSEQCPEYYLCSGGGICNEILEFPLAKSSTGTTCSNVTAPSDTILVYRLGNDNNDTFNVINRFKPYTEGNIGIESNKSNFTYNIYNGLDFAGAYIDEKNVSNNCNLFTLNSDPSSNINIYTINIFKLLYPANINESQKPFISLALESKNPGSTSTLILTVVYNLNGGGFRTGVFELPSIAYPLGSDNVVNRITYNNEKLVFNSDLTPANNQIFTNNGYLIFRNNKNTSIFTLLVFSSSETLPKEYLLDLSSVSVSSSSTDVLKYFTFSSSISLNYFIYYNSMNNIIYLTGTRGLISNFSNYLDLYLTINAGTLTKLSSSTVVDLSIFIQVEKPNNLFIYILVKESDNEQYRVFSLVRDLFSFGQANATDNDLFEVPFKLFTSINYQPTLNFENYILSPTNCFTT
jgi:hypothetical protein